MTALLRDSLPPQSASTTSSPPKKKRCLFLFKGAASTNTDSESELQSYLDEPTLDEKSNPLHYWKANEAKYPKLAKQAQRYLAIPASSAPVERMFSVGGKILRPERARMSDRVFECAMFLKCNKRYM
jgi:hypothetical protein